MPNGNISYSIQTQTGEPGYHSRCSDDVTGHVSEETFVTFPTGLIYFILCKAPRPAEGFNQLLIVWVPGAFPRG